MNDLTILHLSDLHIDSAGSSYSRLLKKLLIDIKSEISHTKDSSLLVVVTGDILHRGPKYSDNQKAFDNATTFFSNLHEPLGNRQSR